MRNVLLIEPSDKDAAFLKKTIEAWGFRVIHSKSLDGVYEAWNELEECALIICELSLGIDSLITFVQQISETGRGQKIMLHGRQSLPSEQKFARYRGPLTIQHKLCEPRQDGDQFDYIRRLLGAPIA